MKLLIFFITVIVFISCSTPVNDARLITISITYNEEEKVLLNQFQEEALELGFLPRKLKKRVQAYVNNDMGSIKFKGDATDHIDSDKRSYRINLNDSSILGTSMFSVQHPKVRAYLDELVLHEWCLQENILTTNYDFVNIVENGKAKGVYAFEEYFGWELLERYKRKKAPILYFNEDALFQHYNWRNKYDTIDFFPPLIESAEIEAFNFKDIKKSDSLSKYWQEAKDLLIHYQWNSLPAEKIFDLDNAAKYYAIITLNRAFHGLAWHNQRFYYDPVKKRFEHLLYDGSNQDGKRWANYGFYGYYDLKKERVKHNVESTHQNLFLDTTFTLKYLNYLEEYADSNYIKVFLDKLEPRLRIIETAISNDEKIDYKFDRNILFEYASNIRLLLPKYKKIRVTEDYMNEVQSYYYKDYGHFYKNEYPSVLVKAYQNKDSIQIINFFHSPVKIKKINKFLDGYKVNTRPEVISFFGKLDSIQFYYENKEYSIGVTPYSYPRL